MADAFTEAGIMVHAYLMYGFPTQSDQETIDSLEMVRQLFENGVIQSGFWHQFAMTAHSPVGLNPVDFQVHDVGPTFGGFADNDRQHEDALGAQHERYSEGLRKSLFNYMHGLCFEFMLDEWFDFKVPQTSISPEYIEYALIKKTENFPRQNALLIWLGGSPEILTKDDDNMSLAFNNKQTYGETEAPINIGNWWLNILPRIQLADATEPLSLKELKTEFESIFDEDFSQFMGSPFWMDLRANGLLIV